MTWIDDNKGLGPWAFIAQPDKPHYNEGNLISNYDNPVWAMDFIDRRNIKVAEVTPTHHPWCGYWTKEYVPWTAIVENLLYSTGENDYGNLALGDSGIDRSIFEKVPTDPHWSYVACGALFVAALKNDGTLWVSGQGTYGQLGLGEFSIERDEFVQVGTDVWTDVSCLNHSMLAVRSDGTLWGTGYNVNGELGLGLAGAGNKNVLTRVGTDSDWAKVEGGQHFVIATKTNGEIYGTGRNTDGELGLGDRANRNVFTFIDSGNWASISCGGYHTLGIKTDGTLWATGVANSGQLGLGPAVVIAQRVLTLTQVGVAFDWTMAKAGYYHSMALKSDNTLYGTGLNFYGELGLGDDTLRDVFTQVTGSNWIFVDVGYTSSYALTANNYVYSTGANANGELGHVDTVDRNIFEHVTNMSAQLISGGNHFAFILTN